MSKDIITITLIALLVGLAWFPPHKWHRKKHKHHSKPHYTLGAIVTDTETFLFNLNNTDMSQQVFTDQTPFSVVFQNPVDATGKPAIASGNEVWTSSDATVATVVVNTNTLQGDVTLTGTVGSVTLTITDPNTGVTGTADIVVVERPAGPIADFGQPTFVGIN